MQAMNLVLLSAYPYRKYTSPKIVCGYDADANNAKEVMKIECKIATYLPRFIRLKGLLKCIYCLIRLRSSWLAKSYYTYASCEPGC